MTAVQKRSEALLKIAEAVCASAKITKNELIGDYQGRSLTNARKVFSILAKMFGVGVVETSEFLGYADHSNIVTNQKLFFMLFPEDSEIQILFKSALNKLI